MNIIDIIIALTVYIFIPLTGLYFFLRLRKQMKIESIQTPPIIELFVIFATYGGLLLLTLKSFVWPLVGSALDSLGTFYLIIVAPIVMSVIAYRHRKTKTISKFHNWTYLSGLFYFAVAPVTFIVLLLISKN